MALLFGKMNSCVFNNLKKGIYNKKIYLCRL